MAVKNGALYHRNFYRVYVRINVSLHKNIRTCLIADSVHLNVQQLYFMCTQTYVPGFNHLHIKCVFFRVEYLVSLPCLFNELSVYVYSQSVVAGGKMFQEKTYVNFEKLFKPLYIN